MRLPEPVYASKIKKAVQTKFGGWQHTPDAQDGQLYDMTNLSSRSAPLLTPRLPRRTVRTLAKPNGVYAMDKLAWVDGTVFYYDGVARGAVANSRKRFCALGSILVILPDKVYYDTRDAAAVGNALEPQDSLPTGAGVAGMLCLLKNSDGSSTLYRSNGTSWGLDTTARSYGDILRTGTSAPYDLYYYDGAAWREVGHKSFGALETGTALQNLRLQDGFWQGEPAEENTLYHSNFDFRTLFRAGDAVDISGLSGDGNRKSSIIREISKDGHALYFSEYAFTMEPVGLTTGVNPEEQTAQMTGTRYVGTSYSQVEAQLQCDQTTEITCDADGAAAAVGKYYIKLTKDRAEKVQGKAVYKIIEAVYEGEQVSLTLQQTCLLRTQPQSGTVSIRRRVPDMDWLCANENRLWGCKGDHIYACKPGDPWNWYVFDGLASDSYAVDAGSQGDFTGAASYLGYPCFFKERNIYKVYGSLPSNFELMGAATMGVARDAGGSLAVAGETLLYLSPAGPVAYTGAMPASLAEPFGGERLRRAEAGSDGLKYYMSAQRADGTWSVWVYDTQRGMWHREDDVQAVGWARAAEGLHCLDSDGVLWMAEGRTLESDTSAWTPEETVAWSAEFGDFVEDDPNRKAVSRMQIRVVLEAGASFAVDIGYAESPAWQKMMEIKGLRSKRSYTIPVIPRRTDHWRLRLRGTGTATVFSIAREYYVGSDLR